MSAIGTIIRALSGRRRDIPPAAVSPTRDLPDQVAPRGDGLPRYFVTRAPTDAGWEIRVRRLSGADMIAALVMDFHHGGARDWSEAWADAICAGLAATADPDYALTPAPLSQAGA